MTPHPTFDVAELLQEASERAAVDFRSAYSLRSGRRSLELLQTDWSVRGYNLWSVEGPITITLTPGQNRYSLPEDTIDLVEHSIRTWNASVDDWSSPERFGTWGAQRFTDMPLTRISMPDYAAIPNKEALGRPTLIHIRRQIKPYFMLWMTPPPVPWYQVNLWRLRRMRSVGSGGEGEPEIPWRFIPALIAGLAYNISLKNPDPAAMQRTVMLKQLYEEAWQTAADDDRDRASTYLVPWTPRW